MLTKFFVKKKGIKSFNLHYGIDCIEDKDKSKEIYMLGCNNGDKLSMAFRYFLDYRIVGNEKKAFDILNEILLEDQAEKEELGMIYYILGSIYNCEEEGDDTFEKDIKKSIEFYQKSIQYNNFLSMFFLASIYENAEAYSLQKDFDLITFYYFKNYQLSNIYQDFALRRLISIIENHKIEWKEEYHIYWKSTNDLNNQILVILLSSKFRKNSKYNIVSNILVKGITMKIIKFICHFNQIITD
jgi:TPR repeat protein